MPEQDKTLNLLELTTHIITAQCSANKIEIFNVSDFIKEVFGALQEISLSQENGETLYEKLVPAVPIDQSYTDDYIICLEDGKKLQMLKRHLRATYNLTIDQYKERWNLPDDYPSVCVNYSKKRTKIAREINLGFFPKKKKKKAK